MVSLIALEELKKAEILAGDNKEFIIQVLTMRADVLLQDERFCKIIGIVIHNR